MSGYGKVVKMVSQYGHHRNNTETALTYTSVRLLFICFLMTAFQHQKQPGCLVSASLTEFCGLETITVELEWNFEEGDTGDYIRCRGNVTLTSCEGQCVSSVAPSVVSTVGFVKICTCCREVSMKSIKVQLANCITAEGDCISNYVHEMVIQEPSKCACQTCNP